MAKSTNQGQSLFEVIIAVGVTSIVLVAIINTAIVSVRNTSYSRNKTLAARHIQEANEWLRGERDASWDSFSAHATISPSWCLSTLDWAKARSCTETDNIVGTPFERELILTIISTQQISTQVKVYWNDSQGYHEVKSATYLTDWRISQ